jgi:hypothetical protein
VGRDGKTYPKAPRQAKPRGGAPAHDRAETDDEVDRVFDALQSSWPVPLGRAELQARTGLSRDRLGHVLDTLGDTIAKSDQGYRFAKRMVDDREHAQEDAQDDGTQPAVPSPREPQEGSPDQPAAPEPSPPSGPLPRRIGIEYESPEETGLDVGTVSQVWACNGIADSAIVGRKLPNGLNDRRHDTGGSRYDHAKQQPALSKPTLR